MSLVADIVAALSGGFTQGSRLLRLHTPLGANALLAERVLVHEAIFPGTHTQALNGFAMSVEALSPDTHLELKSLIGQPALLELLTADSRVDLRPWHGHITQAELLGSDGGLARYRLRVEPWLAFLGHRQDSYVFQGQTVVQIIDEVFADYQGQGQLAPAWRWELADASVYPQRSLCIQYQETDLQFVQRLLREEGLIAWWEHTGNASDATLGAHTLVIADHNGAFAANRQARVRYTQSGSALKEDSLTKLKRASRLHTAAVNLASADYRSLSLRPTSQSAAANLPAPLSELQISDVPGAYAYEDSAQGERLALRQMQALDALRQQTSATATLRRAAPGTHWLLTEHPVHTGANAAQDQFVTLAVSHQARNNLSADLKAKLEALALSMARDRHDSPRAKLANQTEEPLYQCQISAQPLATPVRPVTLDETGMPDPRLNPTEQRRPTITGVQTAVVVGGGEPVSQPIHTDRDHRIKIQFHWQRGGGSSLRLNHPASDNAPATEAAGTWVRVAERVAGANWGANFTPRVGQEVLVSFLNGDIDRPVVVGGVYNGKGQDDAQGNQVSAGAANATGNANTWFPGTQAQGKLQAHQHTQVHTGFKTQELSSSQSGSGGYNQFVFDDSPEGQHRVELSSSTQATRLQLGHLLHQNDNQRLNPRGHGLDVTTAAWGALRAGSGILLSAHAKPASTARGQQLDSREPLSRLEQGQQLIHALAETAQAHNAKITAPTKEAEVKGATQKDKAKQLSVEQGLWATQDSLKLTASNGDDAGDENAINGGHGSTTQWGRPDMVLAAPGGIASFTPASHIASAGATTSLAAGQDVHHLAQANHASAAKDGLILFSYGKASNPDKPNQETGIALHAASGSVNTQSQSAATKITADKDVTVASTTAMVKIAAPQKVLLTAAGAAITIQGGSITLNGPGKVELKAGQKVFAGGGSAAASLNLPELPKLDGKYTKEFAFYALEGAAMVGAEVTIFDKQSRGTLWKGAVPASGAAQLNVQDLGQEYIALAGYDAWSSTFDDMDEQGAEEFAPMPDGESDEEGREEEAHLKGGTKNA